MEEIQKTNLLQSLSEILNMYSRENESNTADFVLAEYLMDCLQAYEKAVNWRDNLKNRTNITSN